MGAEDIMEEIQNGKSSTLDKFQNILQGTIAFSEGTLELLEAEERRRKRYPLRNSRDLKLAAEISKLRSAEKNTWKSSAEFVRGIQPYVASVKSIPGILETIEKSIASPDASVADAEDPIKKFGRHITHVYDAIHKLLDVCSPEMLEIVQNVRTHEGACCENLLALVNQMKQNDSADKLMLLSQKPLEMSELMANLEGKEFEDADLRSQIDYQKQMVLQKEENRLQEEN